ncbi:hypothetical protein AAC387_Pa06g1435 [Persea americana]
MEGRNEITENVDIPFPLEMVQIRQPHILCFAATMKPRFEPSVNHLLLRQSSSTLVKACSSTPSPTLVSIDCSTKHGEPNPHRKIRLGQPNCCYERGREGGRKRENRGGERKKNKKKRGKGR